MTSAADEGSKGNPRWVVPMHAAELASATERLSQELERLQRLPTGAGGSFMSRIIEDAVRAQETANRLFGFSAFEFHRARAIEEAQKHQEMLLRHRDHMDWLARSNAIERATELSSMTALDRIRLDSIVNATAIAASYTGIGSMHGAAPSYEVPKHLEENQHYVLPSIGRLSTLSRHVQESIRQAPDDLTGITRTAALVQRHLTDLATAGVSPGLLGAAFTVQSILSMDDDLTAELREKSLLVRMMAGLDEQISAGPDDLDINSLASFVQDYIAGAVEQIAASSTWLERGSVAEILNFLMLIATVLGLYLSYLTYQASQDGVDDAERDEAVIQQELVNLQNVIADSANKIADALQNSSPAEAPGVSYVVVREVPLTETRKFRQMRTATLYPNLVVQLVEAHGKWIAVTYYDYVLGKPVSGWVLKKYLRRVESRQR